LYYLFLCDITDDIFAISLNIELIKSIRVMFGIEPLTSPRRGEDAATNGGVYSIE